MDKTIGIYIRCLQERIKYLQAKSDSKASIELYTLEIVIEDLQEMGGLQRFSYWKMAS